MDSLSILNNGKENNQFIHFKVGKNKYALPISNILEIIELPQLEFVQQNENIIGILNFNNIQVNVVDIRKFLHEEITPYTINNKIILAKTDETLIGIITDYVEDIVEYSNDKAKNISIANNNSIIDSKYSLNNDLIYLLNIYSLENIIKSSEKEELSTFKNLFPSDEFSLEILNKRTVKLHERFNNLVSGSFFSENKFATFSLNNTVFCINLNHIKEFLQNINITPIPCSPSYISGVIYSKGDFITVLNLKTFLNYSQNEYSEKAKLIVINSKEYKLGLLVDNVFEILNIPEEKIQLKEDSTSTEFIKEEYIDFESVKPILNIDKLLQDNRLYINQ